MHRDRSYAGLLWLYWRWTHIALVNRVAPRPLLARFSDGIASARGSATYRRLLVHSLIIFFTTSAFAALLPSLVLNMKGGNGARFGEISAALGAGAVLAAFFLPQARRRIRSGALLSISLCMYAGMLAAVPVCSAAWLQILLVAAGGAAWAGIVIEINAAAQGAFPDDVRARALSIYIFIVALGHIAGSLTWGQLASLLGVQVTMGMAGAATFGCAALVWRSSRR